MSLKWPAKDPSETLDYSVDWSRFLGSNTISSVTWHCYDESGTKNEVSFPETIDGMLFSNLTNTNTVATVRLSAGTTNKTYKIVCEITFGDSLVASRTIQLPVREK